MIERYQDIFLYRTVIVEIWWSETNKLGKNVVVDLPNNKIKKKGEGSSDKDESWME